MGNIQPYLPNEIYTVLQFTEGRISARRNTIIAKYMKRGLLQPYRFILYIFNSRKPTGLLPLTSVSICCKYYCVQITVTALKIQQYTFTPLHL